MQERKRLASRKSEGNILEDRLSVMWGTFPLHKLVSREKKEQHLL